MHSALNDVISTVCSNMIDNEGGIYSYPCWLLHQLIQAEQPIQTIHMSCVAVNGLPSLFRGEITSNVTKKNGFLPYRDIKEPVLAYQKRKQSYSVAYTTQRLKMVCSLED